MSKWFEPEKEEISLSYDGEEIHALIDSDSEGNIWVSLKVKDIIELLKNNEK